MRVLHWFKFLSAFIIGAILLNVLPAQAFSQAFYPTQSKGNKGVDVQALQYLLKQRGFSLTVDGDFGSGTETVVKSFQTQNGLSADGIVGPATWGKLVLTVQQGSTGDAVRALQTLLNAKRSAGLTVDGVFGAGTRAAVISFQQHAGIGADGVVGPTTWQNLLWHYDYPDFSTPGLCDYASSNGTAGNWGTAALIGQLEATAQAFFLANGSRRIPVGDISLEHGGDIVGHASHETGLDVDLRPIRLDNAQCTSGTRWDSANYDRARTRALAQAIYAAAPGHVKFILFNDPQLISEGLTTYYDNHDDHLHVRYCEKVHPNSMYTCP